jgi:predicted YcjX-like family ATPase
MKHEIHLGVTGLRRSGKTVYLTALIYQLHERGSNGLSAFENKGIKLWPAKLIGNQLGRPFPYELHLAALRQPKPVWPPASTNESWLSLEIPYSAHKYRWYEKAWRWPVGHAKDRGTILLHLHDYPGEYLLDLELPKTLDEWSTTASERMRLQCAAAAERYDEEVLAILKPLEDSAMGDADAERVMKDLRAIYAKYARAARSCGMEMLQPGMRLAAWDPEKEDECPVAFVPLPASISSGHPLRGKLRLAYAEYCEKEVEPFRTRLAASNRQLVVVDVLRVLRNGVNAFNDTQRCLRAVIGAYRYTNIVGRVLKRLPPAVRPRTHIDRVIFAASKADHATQSHRANMSRLLEQLVMGAAGDIAKNVREIQYDWFTSIRCTQDKVGKLDGQPLQVLLGRRKDRPEEETPRPWNPGFVPSEWPCPLADGTDAWPFQCDRFKFLEFMPPPLPLLNGAAWPNLNLDGVLWRLLSDCFHSE